MEATTPNEAGVVQPLAVRSLGVPWRWALVSVALLLIALVIGVAVGPAHLGLGGIAGSALRAAPVRARLERALGAAGVDPVVAAGATRRPGRAGGRHARHRRRRVSRHVPQPARRSVPAGGSGGRGARRDARDHLPSRAGRRGRQPGRGGRVRGSVARGRRGVRARAFGGRHAQRDVADPGRGRDRVVPDGRYRRTCSSGTPTRSGRCTRGCSVGSRRPVGKVCRSSRRTSPSASSWWSRTGACWTCSSSGTTRPRASACARVACASGSWSPRRSAPPPSSPSAGRSRSSASSCPTPCGSWWAGATAWWCRSPSRWGRRSSCSPTPWRGWWWLPAELPIGVITAFIGAPFFVMVLRSTRTSAP